MKGFIAEKVPEQYREKALQIYNGLPSMPAMPEMAADKALSDAQATADA